MREVQRKARKNIVLILNITLTYPTEPTEHTYKNFKGTSHQALVEGPAKNRLHLPLETEAHL